MSKNAFYVRMLVLAGFFSMTQVSFAQTATLRICHSDVPESPWVTPDQKGVSQFMMKQLEKQLNVKIEVFPLLWKRCLSDLQENKVDGAFPASFKTERLAMGAYPMKGDKPDETRRLHTEGYSMYVTKNSTLSWNGTAFSGVNGSIGIPSGYSIGDFLKKQGLTVDEGVKNSVDILKKVELGRLQGAALQTTPTDIYIKQDKSFANSIKKLSPALEEKPYYLMLSHELVSKNPKQAQAIWDALMKLRDSAEVKKALEQATK